MSKLTSLFQTLNFVKNRNQNKTVFLIHLIILFQNFIFTQLQPARVDSLSRAFITHSRENYFVELFKDNT